MNSSLRLLINSSHTLVPIHLTQDETLGKIILFGLDGVFTEAFEDTAIRFGAYWQERSGQHDKRKTRNFKV